MTAFASRVAELTGVAEDRLVRLSGGDLSEVLLVPRTDDVSVVAKGGPAVATEAAMLRALGADGIPTPSVDAEFGDVLLLQHVANDAVFSANAWRDIGEHLRRLHAIESESYGWPVDYRLGTIELDNRQGTDWPAFWGEQRLVSVASVLDRPWRERVNQLAARLGSLLPTAPRPSLLHGDLWSGNILVNDGRLAALIDPACYYGDAEVDLAMLSLFGAPPAAFWNAYGALEPGWEERRPIYQLFPILVHLRLFGTSYAASASRILDALGA